MRNRGRGPGEDWRAARFVALDFEATSADPDRAAPLSAGWVVVEDGVVRCASAAYVLVGHRGEVPAPALPVHRLLPDDLADGESHARLAARLREVLDGAWLVAHGAGLEVGLLGRLGVDVGRACAGVVDTLAVVRRLDARDGQRGADPRLVAAAARHGVPPLPAHHALRDALTTAMLLLVLAGREELRTGRCTTDELRLLSRP